MDDAFVSRWMEQIGSESDIVVSSRIRLARNLDKVPFTMQATDKELSLVTNKVSNLINNDNKFDLDLMSLDTLSETERMMLVERHLISPEYAKNVQNRLLALSKDEVISLMVNEEDHLRLQILLPGLELEDGWDIADEVDNYLENNLNMAFDEEYGYLTACPTNVGTGLRASVMVHLPALSILDRVNSLMGVISKLGLAVRGLYGEGTDTIGNLYQISNQVTLGNSEEEIIENLLEVTHQIINKERNARKSLLKEEEMNLKDMVSRAYGTLKHAYSISIEEALELISNVRLGVDLGILDENPTLLTQLMIITRPATLKMIKGNENEINDYNVYRAELIRNKLRRE
ncbi:arginine kinase [Halobacteroides halobius DSM 5150]|uniref:Protein-arginine kinase n=1 Tax=Halobacteroides halobius (strain ATCC 35273 / DSM 5150 / MD-1) TaxID=748449 RepID=L0K4G9_HALHC|nr:protein arginine kinase [Halobacteroides halobius]AGB40167.1 arginine kinase [Halobacteroides halobius DSM 5150]